MVRQFINGICMALADSVPGVSGGTIAFILGFYDAFIGSIHDVFFARGEERKAAIMYLLKLGVGWGIGMIAAVLVLSRAFESHIYFVSSLFLGFVTGVQLNRLSIPLAIYIFVAGMIAICAMFLPGISGSTLLLIFGLYLPVISGIREFLHLDLSHFPGLCIFGFGVITGALSVVKLIKNCLEHYRSQTMYAILGLMIGSLYAIVMGPTSLENPVEALSVSNFHIPAFLIGVGIVAGLHFAGNRKMLLSQES